VGVSSHRAGVEIVTLIKLGRLYLNFDQVRLVRDLSTVIGPGVTAQPLIRFEFEQGPALDVATGVPELLAWLNTQASDLTPSPPPP
jgi:hypothetical protein